MKYLKIKFQQETVGDLEVSEEQEIKNFTYDKKWLSNKNFFISPHISDPKNNDHLSLEWFFENYFPEGEGLKAIKQSAKLATTNTLGLLTLLGNDLPGGLYVENNFKSSKNIIPIEFQELKTRIQLRARRPIAIWDHKPRLSVAGVQDKLNLIKLDESSYGFSDGITRSTHILKFNKETHLNMVLNEHFIIKLASVCGLNVCCADVVNIGEHVLEIKRFDRFFKDGKLYTRHVIDGCQILNIPPRFKYESLSGNPKQEYLFGPANFENIFKTADLCKTPAVEKNKILDWVFFNLLVGNSDFHVKNISFFIDNSGIELAPFYDLLCTQIYPEFSHDLPFRIGGELQPGKLTKQNLQKAAEDIKLNFTFFNSRFNKMIANIENHLPKLRVDNLNLKKDEEDFITELKSLIQSNINFYKKILSGS